MPFKGTSSRISSDENDSVIELGQGLDQGQELSENESLTDYSSGSDDFYNLDSSEIDDWEVEHYRHFDEVILNHPSRPFLNPALVSDSHVHNSSPVNSPRPSPQVANPTPVMSSNQQWMVYGWSSRNREGYYSRF